jgi:hypothetical protein
MRIRNLKVRRFLWRLVVMKVLTVVDALSSCEEISQYTRYSRWQYNHSEYVEMSRSWFCLERTVEAESCLGKS